MHFPAHIHIHTYIIGLENVSPSTKELKKFQAYVLLQSGAARKADCCYSSNRGETNNGIADLANVIHAKLSLYTNWEINVSCNYLYRTPHASCLFLWCSYVSDRCSCVIRYQLLPLLNYLYILSAFSQAYLSTRLLQWVTSICLLQTHQITLNGAGA